MNTPVQIALVNPPLDWQQVERLDIKPPLNLLSLASFLNQRHPGSAVVIDVVGDSLPLETVIEQLRHLRPRFLGVPLYQATEPTALTLCRAAREACPHLAVVGGGPLMTTSFQRLMAAPEIDFGVIGEGELTLQELLDHDTDDR